MLMHMKRKAAAMEEAELNDLHHAEIAMAHANVGYCNIAMGAAKKALMPEMSKFSFDCSDAESDAESCESSSEENSWESERVVCRRRRRWMRRDRRDRVRRKDR